MCLSVPAKVISLAGDKATVVIGESRILVSTALLESVSVDDYVLIHTGFAIEKISKQDADEIIRMINEIDNSYNQGVRKTD